MSNATKARRETEAAIAGVDANADAAWKREALNAVKTVARRKKPFIADDVWAYLAKNGKEETPDPRALGPVIRRAASAGYITQTGNYRPSQRRHMTPMVEWVKA